MNWPNNTDYSSSNWTGRTQRKSSQYNQYTNAEFKIPPEGWVLLALCLFGIFGFLPVLKMILG